MKVRLIDVYNSVQVINKILDTQLPVTIAFQLTKLIKNLDNEVKIVEEQRVKLVSKYGEEIEDKGFTVSEANKEAFLKEFTELLESEIEINWNPVDISKFEGLNLSPNDLMKVSFLFSE